MKSVLTILMFFVCAQPSFSYALGDLLMTEQQRLKINLMRGRGKVAATGVSPSPALEKKQSARIDGFFFKNKDKKEEGVVWIDGKIIEGKKAGLNLQLKRINEKNHTVLIYHEQAGASMSLKVGQKIILESGQIRDAYEP